LALQNCPSTASPFDVVTNLSVSRTISFSVSNSTTGIVTATIPGNDVISCNLPAGETTVWQITAYYDGPNQGQAWQNDYVISGSTWNQATAVPVTLVWSLSARKTVQYRGFFSTGAVCHHRDLSPSAAPGRLQALAGMTFSWRPLLGHWGSSGND